MLTVTPARSGQDFAEATELCRRLAAWDAVASAPHGVSESDVWTLFHSGTDSASLARQFDGANGHLFIARWNGTPSGCFGFDVFDDTTAELARFYVDDAFRGKGMAGRSCKRFWTRSQKGPAGEWCCTPPSTCATRSQSTRHSVSCHARASVPHQTASSTPTSSCRGRSRRDWAARGPADGGRR